jgi:hypothetical protein
LDDESGKPNVSGELGQRSLLSRGPDDAELHGQNGARPTRDGLSLHVSPCYSVTGSACALPPLDTRAAEFKGIWDKKFLLT